jgi:uncharacterized membrane protein YccF (DUF307 family)
VAGADVAAEEAGGSVDANAAVDGAAFDDAVLGGFEDTSPPPPAPHAAASSVTPNIRARSARLMASTHLVEPSPRDGLARARPVRRSRPGGSPIRRVHPEAHVTSRPGGVIRTCIERARRVERARGEHVSGARIRTVSSPLPPPNSSPGPPLVASQPTAPGHPAGIIRTIGNILWLVLAGIWMAIGYVVAGVFQCITIIGIPFGIQSFKLAGFALWPFGRTIIARADRDAALSCVGNVIWLVFGGIWLALGHLLTGLLLCVTIIGIPFGIASFKLAGLALAPFGKAIVPTGAPIPYGARVYVSL